MTEFFKPYEGKNPYLFVSYSHRDSEKVVSTIRLIHDRLVRLWYDEGIPAGSDWPRNIAVHMRDCRMVLFFLSRTALASPNCLSEITTAAKQGKPVLLMRLEEIPDGELPARWRGCLQNVTEIESAPEAEQRAARILSCPLLTEDFTGTKEEFEESTGGTGRRSLGATLAMVLSSLLLIAALGGVGGLSTGLIKIFQTPTPVPTETPVPTPEPPVTPTPTVRITEEPALNPKQVEGELNRTITFTEDQQQEERAIRRILGTQEDILYRQLGDIEEIYFVGQMSPGSLKGVEIGTNGIVTVIGPEVREGGVRTAQLVGVMPALRKLALIKQPVKNISALSGTSRLREINLACSSVTDLEGLVNLPSLYSLNLIHTKVKDLTPLRGLPTLAEVYVSTDMLPLTLDPEASYDVILIP